MNKTILNQLQKRQWYKTALKIPLLKLLLILPLVTWADAGDEYFIAYQVSQSYDIPKLLKTDKAIMADDIIDKLIQTHRQKEAIKQYYDDKQTKIMLKKSIEDALSSSEFDSWLNEKIAIIYSDIYNEEELKKIYKNSRILDNKDDNSNDITQYLAKYIDISTSREHQKALSEQLFLEKLDKQTQDILNQLPKPISNDEDNNEYY